MKKTIFFVIVLIFALSASTVFANKSDRKSASDNTAVPVKTENRLSEEEISRLTKRVEEIRNMDKTDLTAKERRELRKEVKGIKENVKKSGGTIYISGAALIVLIILILLLV